MEKGVPVRAISRCLAILQFINRQGPVSLMEIAKAVRLPYPTTIRIVQTLVHEGMLEWESVKKLYRATSLVQTLAVGVHEHGDLLKAGRPVLIAVTREHGWPASISTAVGPTMMVRDSTYSMTSLSFNNYYPGYTFPMLEVASGLAHLAFVSDETREILLAGLVETPANRTTLELLRSGALVRRIQVDGLATHDRTTCTLNPGKTSSIALPILEQDRVAGVFSLSFYSSSMPMAEAVRRYEAPLKAAAATIGRSLEGLRVAPAAGDAAGSRPLPAVPAASEPPASPGFAARLAEPAASTASTASAEPAASTASTASTAPAGGSSAARRVRHA